MSTTATFETLVEFVSSEEVKLENAVLHKWESYLHDPGAKYPRFMEIYLQDKVTPGFYAVTVEMTFIKGKMGFRKQFHPATPDQLKKLPRVAGNSMAGAS